MLPEDKEMELLEVYELTRSYRDTAKPATPCDAPIPPDQRPNQPRLTRCTASAEYAARHLVG